MAFHGAQNTDAKGSIFIDSSTNNQYNYSASPDLRTILKPVDREGFIPKCMEGTRKDVLQQIKDWMDDFDAPNILLLTGSPGAGKSTISSTLIADLSECGRLASSFFFKREYAARSDPTSVWRTVAFDLAQYDSTLADGIADALQERRVDPGIWDIELHFKHMVQEPLKRYEKLVIIWRFLDVQL
jgi:tRNA A37 threonylcarbamoyladenosine biosynthesis protein TsaE